MQTVIVLREKKTGMIFLANFVEIQTFVRLQSCSQPDTHAHKRTTKLVVTRAIGTSLHSMKNGVFIILLFFSELREFYLFGRSPSQIFNRAKRGLFFVS